MKKVFSFLLAMSSHKLLRFVTRYSTIIASICFAINLLFYPKPRSLILALSAFMVIFFGRLIADKFKKTKYIKDIIFQYVTFVESKYRFNYAEAILLSVFITDLAFEKNFAIIACIMFAFVFIALDLLSLLSLESKPLGETDFTIPQAITTFIMSLSTFLFLNIKYGYDKISFGIIFLIALALTIGSFFVNNFKRFDRRIIFTIAAATLLTFLNTSVITP